MPSNPFPHVTVQPGANGPTLYIDGKATFPMLLMTGPEAAADLSKVGGCPMNLITDSFSLGWTATDTYDFAEFDNRVRQWLNAVPDALLMPRINIDAPADWLDAHPDELIVYAGLEEAEPAKFWGGERHASFASAKWRAAAGEALRRLVEHAKASDYAPRILGWHLGGGIYGEWHPWYGVAHPDNSPAMEEALTRWLERKYGEDAPPPRMPTLAERRAGDEGVFRDPMKSQWLLDYFDCFHEEGADALIEFAQVVKDVSQKRSIVVAFNGYLPDLGVNQEIDQRAFGKVLRSDVVDGFASPHSYHKRKAGDHAMVRGYPASVRAHGKLWLDEADERTHIAGASPWKHIETREHSLDVLWRSFAHAVTHDFGLWFMDQGGLWFMGNEKGWYQDAAIVDAFARMREEGDKAVSLAKPRDARVAVVSDLRSALYVADRTSKLDHVSMPLMLDTLDAMWRSGVPFDMILKEDALADDAKAYDMYLFLDAWHVSDEEMRRIDALRAAGSHTLFFYAAGVCGDHAYSVPRMQRLLGMPVSQMHGVALSTGEVQHPGFRVPDVTDGIASAGRSHFCPAPAPTAARLRQLFRKVGLHNYCASEDVLMVGGSYIGLHTATAGKKTLTLPAPATWRDVRTGEIVAENAASVTFDAAMGWTALYQIA
jgi:hypothetical protein